MPMDPQLAAIYGTNQDGEDTEKLAAAELAEKLAADGETDPAEFSDEQIQELAAAALAEAEGDEVKEPEEDEEEEQSAQGDEEDEDAVAVKEPDEKQASAELEKEAKAKLAEADYLGRVMAHAYVQELRSITEDDGTEKTAGPRMDAFKAKAKDVAGKAKAHFGKAKAKGSETGGKVLAHLKTHKKKYVGGAAGAAVAGGGAYAYKKHKKAAAETEEQPSALDILAARRAEAILKENGIELTEPETEKQSASNEEQEALANAVEARAMEMLAEAGYVEEQAEEQE